MGTLVPKLREAGWGPSWQELRSGGTEAGGSASPRSGDGRVLPTATPGAVFVLVRVNETNSWEAWKLCEPPPAPQGFIGQVGFI